MTSTNNLLKEQKKRITDDGPFLLAPSVLSKIQDITSSLESAELISFASSIPTVAGLPGIKAQAIAVKALVQQVVARSIDGNDSDGDSNTSLKMIHLLCDVLLSPGSRQVHRPLLSGLKSLPPTSLEALISYLRSQILINFDGKCGNNSNNDSVLDYSAAVDTSLIPMIESIMPFSQWYLAVVTNEDVIATVASCVVASLEHWMEKSMNAVRESSGAVNEAVVQAIHIRISILYFIIVNVASDVVASRIEEYKISIHRAASCFLNVLKIGVLPKECMASAAVALCRAAALPLTTSEDSGAEEKKLRHIEEFESSRTVIKEIARAFLFSESYNVIFESQDVAILLPTVVHSDSDGDNIAAEEEEQKQKNNITKDSSLVLEWLHRERNTSLASELTSFGPWPSLCMLRGMIQAFPSSVIFPPFIVSLDTRINNTKGDDALSEQSSNTQSFNIVTDGVIATVCHALRVTSDPGFKYLGLQVLTAALERLLHASNNNDDDDEKKLDKHSNTSAAVPQLSDSQQSLLLGTLWSLWDDGAPHTSKLAYQAFSQLLQLVTDPAFITRVVHDVLNIDSIHKRKYAPLAAIIPIFGAQKVLDIRAHLVEETLAAMVKNVSLASAAASMLSALWSELQKEYEVETHSSHEDDDRREKWRSQWVPQIVAALCSTEHEIDNDIMMTSVQDNSYAVQIVCTYAVPAIAALDPEAINVLLVEVSGRPDHVATPAVIALLSTGRKLNLVTDLHPKLLGSTFSSTNSILSHAVTHRIESYRAGVLNLACLHPRNTSIPTEEELYLVEQALNMDLHTTSASVRQNFVAPFGRLLVRMRISVAAVLTRPKDFPNVSIEDVARCESWLQRLCAGLLASAYPGAQYGRKYMATDAICMVLEVFGDLLPIVDGQNHQNLHFLTTSSNGAGRTFRRKGPLVAMKKGDGVGGAQLQPDTFRPFPPDFYSPSLVKLLLGCALDSWDRVRESAAEALLLLPTPLPGLETPEALLDLMKWGLSFLSSPRLMDADSGARILLLVFQQGVLNMGYRCGVNPPAVYSSKAEYPGANLEAVIDYLATMVGFISRRVDAGRENLAEAAKESLAHGPLLALRYLIPAVPWTALMENESTRRSAQAIAERLLSAIHRLNAMILPILSTPEEMTRVGAADVVGIVPGNENQLSGDGTASLLGPEAQVITCACWMSAKEVSLVIGTLCQSAPVALRPRHASEFVNVSQNDASQRGHALLHPSKLESAGELLLRTLIESKHNGAVDKTQQGLEAVAATVLGADPSTKLPELPAQWLDRVLTHLRRPHQSRRDIVRRSAGLPYALQALLKARSAGGARVLAAKGFHELLLTASGGICTADKEIRTGDIQCWPRVHAFNSLRVAFLDNELALESAPFHSQGLQVAITALASPEWEVRNAAMLCFTALLTRILGFANLSTRNTSRKSLVTATEFFISHPTLFPFLLDQLQNAAEELRAGAKDLHPSLSPILTLLMRLQPDITGGNVQSLSTTDMDNHGLGSSPPLLVALAAGCAIDTPTQDLMRKNYSLDLFIPWIQVCAASRPMAVRQQAAKALVPLIQSPDVLAHVTRELTLDVSSSLLLMDQNGSLKASSWNANRIQGQIMQLIELVDMMIGMLHGAGALAEPILAIISSDLTPCICACAPSKYPCPAISHSLLRLVQSVAALVIKTGQETTPKVTSFIRIASEQAWVGVLNAHGELTTHSNAQNQRCSKDGMLGVALKEAVLLRMVWQPLVSPRDVISWVDDAAIALQSPYSEVRSAVLKAALRLLGQGSLPVGKAAVQGVRDLIFTPLELDALRAILEVHISDNNKSDGEIYEKHHKTLRRTLHVLSILPRVLTDSDPAPLALLAQTATEPSTRRYAMVTLGPVVHYDNNNTNHVEYADLVVKLADECSRPQKVSDLRLATVSMLGSSGLLISNTISTENQLSAWNSLMRLLEDEYEDIRCEAAAVASTAMLEWKKKNEGIEQSDIPPVDSCAEIVQYAVYEIVTQNMGGSMSAIARKLRNQICSPALAGTQVFEALQAAETARQGYSGRLFEIETDNHHAEPVLVAQLAANALAALPRTSQQARDGDKDGDGGEKETLQWALEAIKELQKATKMTAWESILNFKATSELESAFSPAYSLILTLWSAGRMLRVTPSWEERKRRSAVPSIIKSINKSKSFSHGLGSHPILRGAWAAAVHEWLGSPPPTTPSRRSVVRRDSVVLDLLWNPTSFLFDVLGSHVSPGSSSLLSELHQLEQYYSSGGSIARPRDKNIIHCAII